MLPLAPDFAIGPSSIATPTDLQMGAHRLDVLVGDEAEVGRAGRRNPGLRLEGAVGLMDADLVVCEEQRGRQRPGRVLAAEAERPLVEGASVVDRADGENDVVDAGDHVPTPPRPRSRPCAAAAPAMPLSSHQRTSASSRPWVTQTSARPEFGDRRGQFVPVGMIGEDQRQFDAAPAWRAGGCASSRRRSRRPDRGSAAPSARRSRDGGQTTTAPAKSPFLPLATVAGASGAERDALLLVEPAELLHRAVEIDRCGRSRRRGACG